MQSVLGIMTNTLCMRRAAGDTRYILALKVQGPTLISTQQAPTYTVMANTRRLRKQSYVEEIRIVGELNTRKPSQTRMGRYASEPNNVS